MSRLFVRAIDISVFAEVALASLCDNKVVALEFCGDSPIGVGTIGPEDGAVTLDLRDAVTIAGVGHRASFSFVLGGDGEFDTETVVIKRPNLELAGWACPDAVDLGGRDTFVALASRRNNCGDGQAQRQGLPCFSHDAVTEHRNTRTSFGKQENYSAKRKTGLLVDDCGAEAIEWSLTGRLFC